VHPFDLRTVLFAKHAQHVVVIHFPIALFTAGVLFDFLAHWTKRQSLAAAAYWNFLFAALAAIPTVVTGILAWQWQLEGQRLKGILLMHLGLGWLSAVLIWTVWLVHRKAQRKEERPLPRYRFAIEALALAIVTVTGHLGGFLSGVNAPG
jgi:uncharacterized membrane protein